jgi:hypothetical protein
MIIFIFLPAMMFPPSSMDFSAVSFYGFFKADLSYRQDFLIFPCDKFLELPLDKKIYIPYIKYVPDVSGAARILLNNSGYAFLLWEATTGRWILVFEPVNRYLCHPFRQKNSPII